MVTRLVTRLVPRRRGWTPLGCLFTLAVLGCAIYVGVTFGHVYWRFYQYQVDMRQEVKFAAKSTNEQFLARIRANADSLGMPDDASRINIRRDPNGITIESEYTETVHLPHYSREIKFRPHAEGPI